MILLTLTPFAVYASLSLSLSAVAAGTHQLSPSAKAATTPCDARITKLTSLLEFTSKQLREVTAQLHREAALRAAAEKALAEAMALSNAAAEPETPFKRSLSSAAPVSGAANDDYTQRRTVHACVSGENGDSAECDNDYD
uniref:Uncharacterized protein n=2 Tax=Chrysotila carterae TaxID=13221 RepID=A0A7S4ERK5_CHRCT